MLRKRVKTVCGAALLALALSQIDAGPLPQRQSPAFQVRVEVDAAARTALAKAKEGITISVYFVSGDEWAGKKGASGSVTFQRELPPEGGLVTVPPQALPAAATRFDINVFSARKTQPDNLLACGYAGGETRELTKDQLFTVKCTLLSGKAVERR